MRQTPDATVIIPAFNAELTIAAQLEALAHQSGEIAFEVIVADNGSTDATAECCEAWAGRLDLQVIDASARRGPGYARNRAAEHATAPVLLFCDADDVVDSNWVGALQASLKRLDVAAGRIRYGRLNDADLAALRRVSDWERLPKWRGFLTYGITANLGVTREAFASVSGFDESFGAAGDDLDLCWRLQLAGYELGFAPDAVVDYRLREDDRTAARQRVLRGIAEAHLYAKHRRHGMPRRASRVALRTLLSLVRHSPAVLGDRTTRAKWTYEAATRWGNLVGSARHRVPYL